MQHTHPITLIVGLANPGDRYQHTRHNAGSWFIENLLSAYDGPLKSESKLFASSAQITVNQKTIRLAIPTTYMNESGKAVLAVMNFYKIAATNVLIAHDELDLPVGTIRLKHGGGSGGHNGLRSIAQCLGTQEFNRLRIGIGRPVGSQPVVDYVLHVPTLEDNITIAHALDRAKEVLPLLVIGEFDKAMTRLHTEN